MLMCDRLKKNLLSCLRIGNRVEWLIVTEFSMVVYDVSSLYTQKKKCYSIFKKVVLSQKYQKYYPFMTFTIHVIVQMYYMRFWKMKKKTTQGTSVLTVVGTRK